MVNPAQATVEQAKSEAKQLKETTQGKALKNVQEVRSL